MANAGQHTNCCSYESFIVTNPNLAAMLKIPESYYDKCHVCLAQHDSLPQTFRVVMRMTLSTVDEIQTFLRRLSKESYVTWRTTRCDSYMSAGRKNLFWKIYHCQNSNAKLQASTKKPHLKRTGCTARLSVTVKRVTKRMRSLDPHLPTFPTKLEFVNGHNHETFSVDNLKFRDVDQEVEAKFKNLFESGFTPIAALDLHKYDLQTLYGHEYHLYVADTCYCPSLQWCYRTYYKTLKSLTGASGKLLTTTKEIDEEALLKLKADQFSDSIRYDKVNGQICIAMCTPLMRRVHKYLPSSNEVVFVDAFDTNSKAICRVYVLLSSSCAGGIPLGVLIISSEDQEQLNRSLQLYKSLLSDDCFYGNGDKGPAVFMIGNSVAERESLTASFPDSKVLLCVAHLFKALWRYLWDDKNGIASTDRVLMLNLVRHIIFSNNEDDLVEAYVTAQTNAVASKYSEFLAYLCRLWDERTLWAAPYLLSGDNPALIEASMKVFREKILHRAKSYSVTQLIEFIFSRVDAYYERKLLRLVTNNFDNLHTDLALFPDQKFDSSEYEITKFLECGQIFQVKHKGRACVFEVAVEIHMCSCPVGILGFLCKHQYLVVIAFDLAYFEFCPVEDEQSRSNLRMIAAGDLNKDCDQNDDTDDDESEHEIFNNLIVNFVGPLAAKVKHCPSLRSAVDTFKINFATLESDEELVVALNSFGRPKPLQKTVKTVETVRPHTVFRKILPKQDDCVKVGSSEMKCDDVVEINQRKLYSVSNGRITQSSIVNEHDYSIPIKH